MFNLLYSLYNIIIISPRLLYILAVLIFNGVFINNNKRGKRISRSFTILGPSFIKFGQALSVRPDIVGEKIAEDLSELQDKIPPFASSKAISIVEKELGKKISELFSYFNEESVAAASIAQVHKATTTDGEHVAVKILRPNIEKDFKRDIKLFYSIAYFLKPFKKAKRLRPEAIVDVFAESVKKELDLRLEAASASELKENCANDNGIYIPNIYWNLTSQRVLVTQWINAIGINNKKNLLEAGLSLEKVSENLSISFLNQSFRDGFFHADIHPGNLFVDNTGKIVPVDFGIMGRLDRQTRIFVAQILRGFLTGDYKHVAKVHFDAGYVPKHKSEQDFMLACRAIGEPIMGLPANQVSIARLLAMLFKVTEDFEMETQPQLLLLQKTMVLIEGVGQKLYPNVNMWQQAEEWIKIWAKDNLSAEACIKENAKEMVSIIIDLPNKLKKIDLLIDTIIENRS